MDFLRIRFEEQNLWYPPTEAGAAGTPEHPAAAAGHAGEVACAAEVVQPSYEELQARVQALETANERLEFENTHDELTGLLNKRGFERVIDAHIANGNELEISIVDANSFKNINDMFGHHVGNRVLDMFGAYLSSQMRNHESSVARLSGDEFAFLTYRPSAEEIGGRRGLDNNSESAAAAQDKRQSAETGRRNPDATPIERIRGLRDRLISEVSDLPAIQLINSLVPANQQVGLKAGAAIFDPAQPITREQLLINADSPKGASDRASGLRVEDPTIIQKVLDSIAETKAQLQIRPGNTPAA